MHKSLAVGVALFLLSACTQTGQPKPPPASPTPEYNTSYENLVAGTGGRTTLGRTGNIQVGFEPTCVGAVLNTAMYMYLRELDVAINEFSSSAEYRDALSGLVHSVDTPPPPDDTDDEVPPKQMLIYNIQQLEKYGPEALKDFQSKDILHGATVYSPHDGVFYVHQCTDGQAAEIFIAVPQRRDGPMPTDLRPELWPRMSWALYHVRSRWEKQTWRVEYLKQLFFTDPITSGLSPATDEDRRLWIETFKQLGTAHAFLNGGREWGRP